MNTVNRNLYRTNNEKTPTLKDASSVLKSNSGFTCDYDDILEYAFRYHDLHAVYRAFFKAYGLTK